MISVPICWGVSYWPILTRVPFLGSNLPLVRLKSIEIHHHHPGIGPFTWLKKRVAAYWNHPTVLPRDTQPLGPTWAQRAWESSSLRLSSSCDFCWPPSSINMGDSANSNEGMGTSQNQCNQGRWCDSRSDKSQFCKYIMTAGIDHQSDLRWTSVLWDILGFAACAHIHLLCTNLSLCPQKENPPTTTFDHGSKALFVDASTCPIRSANKNLGPPLYRFRSMNSVQTLVARCFGIPAMSTLWHWDIVCVSLRADAALERDETGQGFLRPPEHHFFEERKLTISKHQRRLFKWIGDSCAGCAKGLEFIMAGAPNNICWYEQSCFHRWGYILFEGVGLRLTNGGPNPNGYYPPAR